MLQILFDYIPYILSGVCLVMAIVIIGCIISLAVGKKKAKRENLTEKQSDENQTENNQEELSE